MKKPKSTGQKKINIRALKTNVWEAMSKFVRGDEKICASCGVSLSVEESDLGHYRANSERNMSLGGNALWYYPKNLHKQCRKCNRYASGNLVGYTVFLENKYGYGVVQEIDNLYRTYKLWTVKELQDLLEYYKSKI